MRPPAPGIFSTTIGRCGCALRPSAQLRPTASLDPPAANGTTSVSGRVGQLCADADETATRHAREIATACTRMDGPLAMSIETIDGDPSRCAAYRVLRGKS